MHVDDAKLEIETIPDAGAVIEPGRALERFRKVSLALSDAARRKRVSSRGRNSLRAASRLTRWLLISSFLAIVVAPTLAAAAYYAFFAANQYLSEADFTVAVDMLPAKDTSSSKDDALGAMTGASAMMIIQDTQVVVNFIHSRAAVDKLEQAVGIREAYSDPDADWISRFNPKRPIERLVKYWDKMSSVSIEMPGGIVRLEVRAFTPEAARKIAAATVDICEQLVNDMNERINKDAVGIAERELRRASERVAAAQTALEQARNEAGMVDTKKSAESIGSLLKESRSELLNLQASYDVHLKDVSPSAPQMQQLSSRIDVTRKQIAEIESLLTTSADDLPRAATDPTIAQAMTKFSGLELEAKVAEELYSDSAAGLELARLNAEDKMLYLKTFVTPEVAEEARYPRRALNTLIVLAGSFAAWGLLCALAAVVRNRLA